MKVNLSHQVFGLQLMGLNDLKKEIETKTRQKYRQQFGQYLLTGEATVLPDDGPSYKVGEKSPGTYIEVHLLDAIAIVGVE